MSMGNLSVAFKTLKKMEPLPLNNMSEDHSEEVQWSSSVRQPKYMLRSEFKTASDGTNYGLFNLDPCLTLNKPLTLAEVNMVPINTKGNNDFSPWHDTLYTACRTKCFIVTEEL